MNIPATVKAEFKAHILSRIEDGVLTDENREDWHHYAFNEDHYIIGYYQAGEWLKKHGVDSFAAIGVCQDYEKDNFGELSKEYDNAETTVNMLAYVWGEEVLNEALSKWSFDYDLNDLKEALED